MCDSDPADDETEEADKGEVDDKGPKMGGCGGGGGGFFVYPRGISVLGSAGHKSGRHDYMLSSRCHFM